MFSLLSEDERLFFQELKECIIRYEGDVDNLTPIFKEGTPEKIKQQYYDCAEEIKLKKAMCDAFDIDLALWIL